MHCTNNILVVKPANFGYNVETAKSNAFQNPLIEDPNVIARDAILEFESFTKKLTDKGINVLVVEDTPIPIKPDAIFPNNWGSFHADRRVVLYPMLAKNRRPEKRKAILDTIQENFELREIIDLSYYEEKGVFLEGTGSIIFDHEYKIAYACLTPRTNKDLFNDTCKMLEYKPVHFTTFDKNGKEIYHTNVMMNIGNGYAVVCLESIANNSEKEMVVNSLKKSQKEIIDISYNQMASFCGNMIELDLPDKKNILAMSQTAYYSLTTAQKITLESYCELFPLQVDTIERIGGGSVRCMISEIFLPRRANNSKSQ